MTIRRLCARAGGRRRPLPKYDRRHVNPIALCFASSAFRSSPSPACSSTAASAPAWCCRTANSDRAKKSLADVLQQFKYEPTTYAPIKTVSATKDQVVCSAVLPLPDGGYVAADFTFYWEGDKANMKYSVARKATDDSPITPPLR